MTLTETAPAPSTNPAPPKPAKQKIAKFPVLVTGVRLRSCIYSQHHKPLVDRVPLPDAEFKASQGLIEIVEVYEA